MKILVFFIFGLVSSSLCANEWDVYTTDDLVNFLDFHGKNETLIKAYESCQSLPFLERPICDGLLEDINETLDDIEPYINDGELNYSKSYPKTRISSSRDLRYMHLYLHAVGSIGLSKNGLTVDNIDYPLAAKIGLKLDATGRGKVRKNHDRRPDEDTKFKVKGDVDVQVLSAFTLNPRVLQTQNSLKLVLEPKFRLIPVDVKSNIKFDADTNWWNSITGIIGALGSFGQVNIDLITGNWDELEDDLVDFGIDFADVMVSTFIQVDDLSNDQFFKKISQLGTSIVNHKLDREADRFFKKQEDEINSKISTRLGLDRNGLIIYEYTISDVRGKSYAPFIPVINSLIL